MSARPASTPTLSLQQARNLHLAAQGLLMRPRSRPRPADVLAVIERMRLLQIDTIHVVARSPYLVLFSRLGAYAPEWLDAALERGEIFECWSHEACFAPRSAFALLDADRDLGGRDGHWAQRRGERLHGAQRKQLDGVLERIRREGALKSADFDSGRRGAGGWWGWKEEKHWLEALFARGELMVTRRERFQRVYDLRERVLAKMGLDAETPELDGVAVERTMLLESVKALGCCQASWIADYFRRRGRVRDADLDAFVAAGDLIRVAVRGWDVPAYVHRAHAQALAMAHAGRLRATHTSLLSPFDPVVWDRARALALFDFDYRIECYVPAPKRQYGYFVLPILCAGRLVGRLDAKAHRDRGVFEVKSIHAQAGETMRDAQVQAIARAIRDCAQWHGTASVEIGRSEPRALAAQLRKALAQGGA